MLDVGDISNALSKICRFAGHTNSFYSVARHSIHVARLVKDLGGTTEEVLQAILHDAPEAYVVDLPTPLKRLVGASYEVTESKVWKVIAELFEISPDISELVHHADWLMVNVEAEQLMNEPEYDGKPWWTPRSELEEIPQDLELVLNEDHKAVANTFAFMLGTYYAEHLKQAYKEE